jgi:hypothetical protein
MLRANIVIAVVFLVLGVAILIETIVASFQHGFGLSVGYMIAAVFLLLGVMRWRALHPRQ